jgi:predicted CXXCH cytochrome family protein
VDGRIWREAARSPERKVVCVDGIPLAVGINRVRIVALRGKSRVAEENLSIMVRSDLSTAWSTTPSGYRGYPFHVGEASRRCVPCHRLDFTAAADNPPSPEQSPCFGCHKQLVKGVRNQHGPAAVWSCLMCHSGKGRDNRPTLTADNSLCGDCHGDSVALWKSKRHTHGPMAVGSCTTCHSPHGSDENALLKVPVYNLCTSCHEEIATRPHIIAGFTGKGHPLNFASNPLKPGTSFSCTTCHNPHATDSPFFLSNYRGSMDRVDYCKTCHLYE